MEAAAAQNSLKTGKKRRKRPVDDEEAQIPEAGEGGAADAKKSKSKKSKKAKSDAPAAEAKEKRTRPKLTEEQREAKRLRREARQKAKRKFRKKQKRKAERAGNFDRAMDLWEQQKEEADSEDEVIEAPDGPKAPEHKDGKLSKAEKDQAIAARREKAREQREAAFRERAAKALAASESAVAAAAASAAAGEAFQADGEHQQGSGDDEGNDSDPDVLALRTMATSLRGAVRGPRAVAAAAAPAVDAVLGATTQVDVDHAGEEEEAEEAAAQKRLPPAPAQSLAAEAALWGLPAGAAAALEEKLGVERFFPVQRSVVPLLLTASLGARSEVGDVCIAAPTGSGKTLAYALPVLAALAERRVPRLRALVVVPTRELVRQVVSVLRTVASGVADARRAAAGEAAAAGNAKEAMRLSAVAPLNVLGLVGRESLSQQQAALAAAGGCDWTPPVPGKQAALALTPDVLVTTPGRLVDHMDAFAAGGALAGTRFTLEHLRFLVVDEADRILGQSFQGWARRVQDAVYRLPAESAKAAAAAVAGAGRELLSAEVTRPTGGALAWAASGAALDGALGRLERQVEAALAARRKLEQEEEEQEEASGSDSNDSDSDSDEVVEEAESQLPQAAAPVTSGPALQRCVRSLPSAAASGVAARVGAGLGVLGDPLLRPGASTDAASLEAADVGVACEPRLRVVLCSATMAVDPSRLATLRLRAPVLVRATQDVAEMRQLVSGEPAEAPAAVGGEAAESGLSKTPSSLTEAYVACRRSEKPLLLAALLRQLAARRTQALVFCGAVDTAHRLARLLQLMGVTTQVADGAEARDEEDEEDEEEVAGEGSAFPVLEFSSALSQRQRAEMLSQAADGFEAVACLVCTDAAGRGIDLPTIGAVIQYDVPVSAAGYVHRAGRTARAGRSGLCVTLADPTQASGLRRTLRKVSHGTPSRLPVRPGMLEALVGPFEGALAALPQLLEAEARGEVTSTAPVDPSASAADEKALALGDAEARGAWGAAM